MSARDGVSPKPWRLAATLIATVSVAGLLSSTQSHAAPLEFENWGTPFGHTLQCSSAGCTDSTTETAILPLGTVNRRATIDQSVSGGKNANSFPAEVVAQTKPPAQCGATGDDGCLAFSIGDGSKGSLSLDYQFSTTQTLSSVGLKVQNFPGSNPFAVDAFFYDGTSFVFADQYEIATNTPSTRVMFDFPKDTMTSEVLLIYNPLAATGTSFSQTAGGLADYSIPTSVFVPPDGTSIESELCCVMTNVPEPRTWSLLIVGLLGIGAVARSRRRLAA